MNRHPLLERIGNTPLLPIQKLAPRGGGVRMFAKAEWFNPGGSIKDRPILEIIRDGERKGLLRMGKTILDATSGNAGISYALIGTAKGYEVELCLPSNASIGRKRILSALGARLIFTSPLEGSDGAIRKARELHKTNPKKYFYGNQYDNELNWEAHYRTTGAEIVRQTNGKVTHFVAGVGTSGTLMGVGRRLRKFDSGVQIIEAQPSASLHGIEGLKHMGSSILPKIYDAGFADLKVTVGTEEAQEMAIKLATEEGLLAGTSAGANVVASLKIARKLKNAVVVTILPDGAERYFSEAYWESYFKGLEVKGSEHKVPR